MSPLVSTIIPTYNRAALVCDAIESVRRQTYRNLEIIVVDDGSTDDTQARLRVHAGDVRIITQSNAGPSAARNRGIEAARGNIVAFLDSDDRWMPTKLERQVRLLQRVGPSVPCCLCNAEVLRPDRRNATTFEYADLYPVRAEGIWENVTEVLARQFLMFTQMVAVRRPVLEKVGGFDEKLWILEDYDLALRLSLEGPWAYIREPLAVYREQSAGSLAATGQRDEVRLLKRALEVREGFYRRVQETQTQPGVQAACLRGVRAFKRQLRGMELAGDSRWSRFYIGQSVLWLQRYGRAIHRRSPWRQKMRVASGLEIAGPTSRGSSIQRRDG